MASVKGNVKDIQEFLRGLGIKKKLFETSMALKCTLIGLKTGFLWDTCLPPSPTALLGLQAHCESAEVISLVHCHFKKMHPSSIILHIQVLILLLEGDTLVTTRENLQRLLNDLKEAPPVFVGFGHLEERPILVDLPVEEREGVLRVVENVAVSKEKVIEVEVEGLNLSCLVGILLGFPAVYNFSDQVGNPLGNMDLVVLQMEVSLKEGDPQKSHVTPVSFSLPLHLKAETEVVKGLHLWWRKLSGGLAWAQPFTIGELAIALSQQVQNLPSVIL